MANSGNPPLDSEELLHLALASSRSGKHEDAIRQLKDALASGTDDARVHYLLGAEHAQIGLYERAIAEMTTAVSLDPSLHTAHFQLGLLHLTSGRAEAAAAAWQPLESLDADHPLRLFSGGLQALAKDDFETCRKKLEKGIRLNTFSATLNQDMRRVLDELRDKTGGPREGAGEKSGSQHIGISAYTGKVN